MNKIKDYEEVALTRANELLDEANKELKQAEIFFYAAIVISTLSLIIR